MVPRFLKLKEINQPAIYNAGSPSVITLYALLGN